MPARHDWLQILLPLGSNQLHCAPIGTSIAEKPAKRVKHKGPEKMKDMDNKFVSTQELGSLLGVTRQTVRNWIKKGHIRAYHIGQNLKIPVREAVRILEHYDLPIPERFGAAFHGQVPLSGAKGANNRWIGGDTR
jgi:excisionase family DNA binding protein